MYILEVFFIGLSYFFGAKAIYSGKYKPSIYSRAIWLLFSLSAFFSVLKLGNNLSVIVLSSVSFSGSSLILLLSLKKSRKIFGTTEILSTALLASSLILWLITKNAFLNLTIVMIGQFLGGVPTFKKVIKDPWDEDILFWFFFAIAAFIAFLGAGKESLSGYLYPLWLFGFNTLMTLLCARRYIIKK